MRTSVVIRTRNEAPRLRLTLASLEGQVGLDEIVVVDDGSTDATADVLAAAATSNPSMRLVRHRLSKGRSAASNAGAEAASGALLVFLDGDTLAGPDMMSRHREAHVAHPGRIGRGETWHLRATRFLCDPESGIFWPHEREREHRLAPTEREAMRVTIRQVREDFASIADRAFPGIYPGVDPRRLYDAEMTALRTRRDSARLWAAASGSNLSVERAPFLAVGGFDAGIDLNEHRELAYRLYRHGAQIVPVADARSYHLTHRAGWRDPLRDDGWARRFRAAHPDAPITALIGYWRALSKGTAVPDFFAS